MAEFHLDPKTIDYDALPPLVPKGVEPESVLGPLVEAWATRLEANGSDDTKASPCVTLDRVALLNGNTGEPINLGELFEFVRKRIQGGAPPDGFVPGTAMALRGCYVPDATAFNSTLRCHFITAACLFKRTDFSGTLFGGDARFDHAAFTGNARFSGATFGGNARFYRASFSGRAQFGEVSFNGDTLFARASFGQYTQFDGTTFGGATRFDGTTFDMNASFDYTTFFGEALFDHATFSGVLFRHATFVREAIYNRSTLANAKFSFAMFKRGARFDGASFGTGHFDNASFAGKAGFREAVFGGNAEFSLAIFAEAAWFRLTSFQRDARFASAQFGGETWFEHTSFGGVACFEHASFSGHISFQGSTFASGPLFASGCFSDQQLFLTDASFATARLQTDSRDTAAFGRLAPARRGLRRLRWWRRPVPWFLQGLSRARWRVWNLGNAHRLRWDLVRGFGELAILTRVSMSALVLVPILAAVWPAVRGAVERLGQPYGVLPPMMPWTWAALFFAAVLVILGRVLYQAHAPQEVREASRVDFTARRAEAFREADEHEREQLLREAIEAVDEAGSDAVLRWFRHRRLVRHHGRVVWIPGRIEDFEYERAELPPPEPDSAQKGATEADEDQGGDEHEREQGAPRRTAEAVMPPESRKMIAVRAGADARYDLIARQNRQRARFALWGYTLAVMLVLVVLWDQSVAIMREVDPHRSAYFGRLADMLEAWTAPALWVMIGCIVLWVVWDAWFGWVRWPRPAKQWDPLKKNRSSFTPVDEMQAEVQRRLGEAGRRSS